MSYGLSTHAQRLAWDHHDRTHGYDDDPSPAEQAEVEDDAFRHWDQYTFAPIRANGGGLACHANSGPPPPSFARLAAVAVDGTESARERPAVASPSSDPDGGPNSWQTWLWAA